MNADPLEEQRVLEEATAAADAPGTELSAETASLREAWLAFGELLESVPSPEAPKPNRRLPAQRTRRWPVLAFVASAVCLLICLDVYRMWNNANESGGVSPSPAAVAMKNTAKSSAEVKQPSTEAAAGEMAWDDSLDEQIAQVGQTVVGLQSSWANRSGAFEAVQYELQQVQQEFEGEEL